MSASETQSGLRSGLYEKWRACAQQAARWASGDDPLPVLEALACSVALELTGDLSRIPGGERDALRRTGQRALLHLGSHGITGEELEALRMCAAVAREGLHALSGRPVTERPGAGVAMFGRLAGEASSDGAKRATESEPTMPVDPKVLVPPTDLTRLLRGTLDGFAAGSLAMKIRLSPVALAELRALQALQAPEERTLSLAAADATAVLDPAEGRPVGALPEIGAEAVLFTGPPRRLAVYAEDPEPLRLIAPELTTEDVREGYWVGRVADGATRLEATLHVGDRSQPWVLKLD